MSRWRYFSYETDPKLACSCCGERGMDPDFMDALDDFRHATGIPMAISSGYRCPQYNSQVSSTGSDGPHTTGRAVDIQLVGDKVFYVLKLLEDFGFTGIGLAQKGKHSSRFLHIDNLKDHETSGPRPWVWTY